MEAAQAAPEMVNSWSTSFRRFISWPKTCEFLRWKTKKGASKCWRVFFRIQFGIRFCVLFRSPKACYDQLAKTRFLHKVTTLTTWTFTKSKPVTLLRTYISPTSRHSKESMNFRTSPLVGFVRIRSQEANSISKLQGPFKKNYLSECWFFLSRV